MKIRNIANRFSVQSQNILDRGFYTPKRETIVYSDKGGKGHNEDFVFVNPKNTIYLIADGMGGGQAADYASRFAVEKMYSFLERGVEKYTNGSFSRMSLEFYMDKALEFVNYTMYNKSFESGFKSMGTTFHAYIRLADDTAYFLHVGDGVIAAINPNERSFEHVLPPQITSNFDYFSMPEAKRLGEKVFSSPRKFLGIDPYLFSHKRIRREMNPEEIVLMYTDGFDFVAPQEFVSILSNAECYEPLDDILALARNPDYTARLVNVAKKYYPDYKLEVDHLLSDNRSLIVSWGERQ